MKPKHLISAALLAFVGVAIATSVTKQARSAPATASMPVAAESAPQEAAEDAVRFVVYYFHGDVRCVTCTNIENRSHETVENFFSDQLAAGELEWRAVNYDTAANAHYRRDFKLAFQSLILAEERAGTIVRWVNLAEVWYKVHEDPPAMEDYIIESIADFIAGGDPT